MHVLGISCHYHDAAAALLRDGVLVAAAQEERFSRKKHDAAFPLRAIEFCLQQAGLEAADLDYVVFYEKPFAKGERLMTTIVATFPRSLRLFREGIHVWLKEKVWIKALIQKHLGMAPDRILFVDHHLSHAASAFFASPFEDAAVLTVDGVGEFFGYLWRQKLWWMMPMFFIIFLFGLLLILGQSSALAPFIYTIF